MHSGQLKSSHSVLLATAWSGGTLAAARNLFLNGIPVQLLSSQQFSAAAWSNTISKSNICPPESDSERFLERLIELGSRDPGQILLPTSDETAWLYATNADQLRNHFVVYQPPIATLRCVLDKKNLAEAATRAGLDALPMWDPCNTNELLRFEESLPFPLLIKPRSHVHQRSATKGVVVSSKAELIPSYAHYLAERDIIPDALLPGSERPILQPFISTPKDGIHSVTGFIDRSGDIYITRHSRKIFQRSPPLGIGICFESVPKVPGLSEGVYRLCREIGYFGIFEVEFILCDEQWKIIDFNPRLFHQIALDIRRGVPLPHLAFLDATGNTEALRHATASANKCQDAEKVVLCDRFLFNMFILARTLTLRMSNKERAHWRRWMGQHRRHLIDVVAAETDMWPAVVYVLSELFGGIRRIPQFVQSNRRHLR
jgi:D-aspartate ligase